MTEDLGQQEVKIGEIRIFSEFPMIEGVTKLKETGDKQLYFKLQFAGTMIRFSMDEKEIFDEDSYSNLLFSSTDKVGSKSVVFLLKYFLSEYIDTKTVEDEQDKE